MARTSENKRERLVRAAADLSHAQGFAAVSLADIAQSADVPLGNIYYYFKTKAAIGTAVITERLTELQQMQAACEAAPTAQGRLKAFVQIFADKRAMLARAGCPVGSLCAELSKDDAGLGEEVGQPFRKLLTWMEGQFAALGRNEERRSLALHLLAALQGIALLANCFHDPALVVREAKLLKAWIDGL